MQTDRVSQTKEELRQESAEARGDELNALPAVNSLSG